MGHPRRSVLGLKRLDFAIFVAYLATLCVAVSIYVPWEDEGRAWMVARSSGLYTMLFKVLRYEGHPALWYLILWPAAHLHLSYIHINWISAAIAAAGIYVLLRFAPFPWYVRALLPFGFALQYQYAVVARSYVLFPLLGFSIAHLYRRKVGNPIALAVALALFANISIHATLAAIGLAVCFWWKWKEKARAVQIAPSERRELFSAAVIFASGLIFVAVCVWPPKELRIKIVELLGFSQYSYHPTTAARVKPVLEKIDYQAAAGSAISETSQRQSSYFSRTAERLIFILAYPVASYHPFAFLFEALILIYLYQRRTILLVLPVVLLVGFLTFGYGQFWHFELLWITFLIVLWIAWEESDSNISSNFQRVIEVAMLLLCLLQIPWTIGAIRYELHGQMFPASAAANYFKTIEVGKNIAGRGRAVTLLPYFPYDIFNAFSKKNVMDVLPDRPDVIVGDSTMSSDEFAALSGVDYKESKRFCGSYYFPDVPPAPLCLIFYTK